mgnify:CR=1 FL=1
MGRPSKLPSLKAPAAISVPQPLWEGNCGPETASLFDLADIDPAPALAVCESCPVASLCLEYAIDAEPFGVWGGTTPEDRDSMRGSALEFTLEQRRESDAFINMLTTGVSRESIADRFGIDVRTVDRATARLRNVA